MDMRMVLHVGLPLEYEVLLGEYRRRMQVAGETEAGGVESAVRRCTQASDETEAGGVESAVGVCRRVTNRRQEVWKVLSVSRASRSRVIRLPGIEILCHSSVTLS